MARKKMNRRAASLDAGCSLARRLPQLRCRSAPVILQQPRRPLKNMVMFVKLSAALTGIAGGRLATPNFDAPVPNSDSVNIKPVYFERASETRPPVFRRLLQIARDAQKLPESGRDDAIVEKVKATPETKYLARSIVLMWYLGAWYDPHHLQELAESSKPPQPTFKVISSKAYTQAWALRVAQAHPMGFSEMQFGYWARPPSDLLASITGN
jgi:hypothetical protein